jgi:hypothetical protein
MGAGGPRLAYALNARDGEMQASMKCSAASDRTITASCRERPVSSSGDPTRLVSTSGRTRGRNRDPDRRHSRRGWRIDKPNPRANIDAVIALAMAVERAEHKPEPVELLGWL